jgi:hypothetical protein
MAFLKLTIIILLHYIQCNDDIRGPLYIFNAVFRIRINFFRIRIQRLRLEANRDPGSGSRALMTKNLKKFTAEKKKNFDQKLQFTYP